MENYNIGYRPAFKAKFLKSDALKHVVEYAVEHGKFDKLNLSRKNIDRACLPVRLLVDAGETQSGMPFISFTKYAPKKNVVAALSMDDMEIVKTTQYVSDKKQNPLKFALEKLIKLGNNAPRNKMFKNVVISNKK